jgi:hypothetical protein
MADIKKAVPAKTRISDGGDRWVVGDGVGIFMFTAGGRYPAGIIPYMSNKRYNVVNVETGELQPDPSTTPVINYPLTGKAVDFVAYYPYIDFSKKAIDANGNYAVSFADQSDPAKIDVLLAKTEGVYSGPIKLVFRHAFSKVTLNIKGDSYARVEDVAAINDVSLLSTPGSASANIATGAITDGPNAGVNLLKAATAAKNYDVTFSAIVAPSSGGGRYFKIMFNGRSILWSIPEGDIFAGNQHYIYWGQISEAGFRVNASNITAWSDNGGVSIKEEIPAKIQQNYRITWDGDKGQYALTNDPTNGGLFFQFGSVVGIYTAHGGLQTLPMENDLVNTDEFHAANDVAWDPTGKVTSDTDAGWNSVPCYNTADHPNTITPESGYHTVENVKAGKGDPCRLVGLDLAKIKNATTADELTTADIDNGRWRLPTPEENKAFSGREVNISYNRHWTRQSGVLGGMFPDKETGDATTFLPALGYRGKSAGQVYAQTTNTNFWSSVPDANSKHSGLQWSFGINHVVRRNVSEYKHGFVIRCVRQ